VDGTANENIKRILMKRHNSPLPKASSSKQQELIEPLASDFIQEENDEEDQKMRDALEARI
jgi:hypothetical protein